MHGVARSGLIRARSGGGPASADDVRQRIQRQAANSPAEHSAQTTGTSTTLAGRAQMLPPDVVQPQAASDPVSGMERGQDAPPPVVQRPSTPLPTLTPPVVQRETEPAAIDEAQTVSAGEPAPVSPPVTAAPSAPSAVQRETKPAAIDEAQKAPGASRHLCHHL